MTNVILLERIERLGELGAEVRVRPGYARNYLLPQGKALRATQQNRAYFEAQRKTIEAENAKRRKDAEGLAGKLENLTVDVIRQASEGGTLYGSVTTRDIADVTGESVSHKIPRSQIELNTAIKTIGLFPVSIAVHPEVKVTVTVNVARTADEAKVQRETGRALIVDERGDVADVSETEKTEIDAANDTVDPAEKEPGEAETAA